MNIDNSFVENWQPINSAKVSDDAYSGFHSVVLNKKSDGIFIKYDEISGEHNFSFYAKSHKRGILRVRIGNLYLPDLMISQTWQKYQFPLKSSLNKSNEIEFINESNYSILIDEVNLEKGELFLSSFYNFFETDRKLTIADSYINLFYLAQNVDKFKNMGIDGFVFHEIIKDWQHTNFLYKSELLNELRDVNEKYGNHNFVNVNMINGLPKFDDKLNWEVVAIKINSIAKTLKQHNCKNIIIRWKMSNSGDYEYIGSLRKTQIQEIGKLFGEHYFTENSKMFIEVDTKNSIQTSFIEGILSANNFSELYILESESKHLIDYIEVNAHLKVLQQQYGKANIIFQSQPLAEKPIQSGQMNNMAIPYFENQLATFRSISDEFVVLDMKECSWWSLSEEKILAIKQNSQHKLINPKEQQGLLGSDFFQYQNVVSSYKSIQAK